ncbi:MAG TPA: hypothetical protein VIW19_14480 [Gaiellaceae bacterium]|jgi:hypothetical protein
MVGQIGPLVQVGRRRTALALHLLGGATGGALIGLVLGFAGLLLRAALGDTLDAVFAVAVPAALAYAASVDLGLLPIRQLTWERQTPGSWPCSLGHYPGIFAWGLDLGLGLTTRIPYQSLLVLPLAALLAGNLPTAVAITTVYGVSRAFAVVAAVSAGGDDFPATCDVIQKRVFSLKSLVGAAALLLAAAIVIF